MGKAILIEDLGPSSVTSATCILVPYSRRRTKLLAAIRAALTFQIDSDVIVVLPRRAPFLRTLLARLTTERISFVASPEPLRHGLSVGRAILHWERVITGDSLESLSSSKAQALLETVGRNPEAGLVSSAAVGSVSGLLTRLSAELVVISRRAVNVAGGADESMLSMQDMVDELAGRFTRQSIPLAAPETINQRQKSLASVNEQRYPWLGISAPLPGPLNTQVPIRSAATLQPAKGELIRVLLDLTKVAELSNGTGQHALRTVRALSKQALLEVHARVGNSTDALLVAQCAASNVGCTFDRSIRQARFDVAFSPCQFESISEVEQLRSFARRVAVSHLDFIAIDNPTYHPDLTIWVARRSNAIAALLAADGVAWLSDSVRKQAIGLGFQESRVPNRVCGTVVGLDDVGGSGLELPVQGPFMAVLGASYHHKGRVYALRLFEQVVKRGWPGYLVIAGWDPPHGSSRAEERSFIAASAILQNRVIELGPLSSSEQISVIRRATALIQPSLTEGFGLLAGEAALLGTPTVMLRRTSLREIYPPGYPGWITGSNLNDDAAVTSQLVADSEGETASTILTQVTNGTEYGRRLVELFRELTELQ